MMLALAFYGMACVTKTTLTTGHGQACHRGQHGLARRQERCRGRMELTQRSWQQLEQSVLYRYAEREVRASEHAEVQGR